MSTSYGTITITNETEAKKAARYFLHSSGGSYVIAGNSQSFNPSDESTYGYNTRIGTSEIQLRYNAIPLAEWGNNKLIFYDTTNAAIAQGSLNPLMSLTSDGLTFLKRGTNTSAAVLTGNGLEIKEGAISLGIIPSGETKHPFEVNSNGELYADNAYIKGVINATNGEFNGNINARSGKIGNWYILEGTSYICQDDLIGEGGWVISTYNSEEQLQYYDSYGSISPRELIPTSIQIKFSGSLNGLNINDNNLYTYETPSLDTEYVIRYSNLDVAVVRVTFSGTYHTFYMTKILNDNITLEVWYYNYTIIDSDNGCLYYNNSTPGNSNSVVLSGKGKISSNSIAGSSTGLSWRMAVGNNFGVTTNGTLYANGANISGHLKALTLSTGNRTSSSTGTAGTYIDGNGAIYVGSDNAFQVSAAGAITATSGSIGGWKIGGDTAHSLWYSSSSSVTTPAGALGSGLILSPGGIYSSTQPGGSTSLLPADKTWAFTASDQFGVTTDGVLYANGANLSGITITGYATERYADSAAEEAVEQYIEADANGIKIAKNVGSATAYNYIDSSGMKIYCDQNLLAAFRSTGITFDTTTPFTIGNTTGQNPSYIRWINTGTDVSPNWKLQINADTIQFGSDGTDISDVVNPYEIETSVESIVANTDSGTTTPTSVTVYFKKAGSSETGYLHVEKTTNGTSWSQHYGPSSSTSFTVPLSSDSSIKFYRFSWYEESTMTNLKNSKMIPVIATGEGTGIDDTTITYATSSSYSTPPSSGWQSTPPYVSQGYYLWTKTIFSYSDGTFSDPVYSVARQGVNGQNGTDVTSQYVTYITAANGVVVRHAGNNNSYPYLMCNATGVYNYYSDKYFSKIDSSGMEVYAGDSSIPVAQFGNTIYLGPSNSKHVRITGNVIDYYGSSGSRIGFIQALDNGRTLTMGCQNNSYTGEIVLGSLYSGTVRLRAITGNLDADFQVTEAGCNYISSNYSSNEAQMWVGTSDTNAEASSGVWFGIGSGGKNHGLYSPYNEKWIVYANTNDPADVFLPIAGARTVTSSATAAYLTSGGRLTRTSSSKRYKHDISDISEPILDPKKLYGLRAVQFKFNEDVVPLGDYMYEKFVPGFIAEEVAEVYPRAAVRDADNAYQIEDWDARYIIPPMLALIQDQKKMIDDLEERISALEGPIN